MDFELVKLEKKALGKDCMCFVCRDESHKYRLSLEDAKMRGIEKRWLEDEKGGYVWERVLMNVTRMPDLKFEIPRAGKRPMVVKETLYFLRCEGCKRSEEFILGSGDKALVKDLLY